MQFFWEGKAAELIYQIKQGAVRTYRLLADGRRQIGMFYTQVAAPSHDTS